jgi:hypothetical protein
MYTHKGKDKTPCPTRQKIAAIPAVSLGFLTPSARVFAVIAKRALK